MTQNYFVVLDNTATLLFFKKCLPICEFTDKYWATWLYFDIPLLNNIQFSTHNLIKNQFPPKCL